MKEYTKIEFEVIQIDSEDIIATSVSLQGEFDDVKEDKCEFKDMF